ncbi:uncharacterized protein LOC116249677 [Nymphaea colorata]|nr:uncharacterized protein LOC116249677 [Nymphaea colorata]
MGKKKEKKEKEAVAGGGGEGGVTKEADTPTAGGGGEREAAKEGALLLGDPTFEPMVNGRLKCVETGHEMPAGEADAYKRSKPCRLALIDIAVSLKKPPLNLFKQDPLSRSKLICTLTGDTVNKSEEHIWKHINGRRFQNKLEQEEEKRTTGKDKAATDQPQPKENGVKKGRRKKVLRDDIREPNSADMDSDADDPDFWEPPIGSRWDFDDGRDRWVSCTSSDDEENETEQANVKDDAETQDLTKRTKRMSVEVGPSSFASRKKKSRVEENKSRTN